MSELVERKIAIRMKIDSLWYTHEYGVGRNEAIESLIEQALLRERRLAMEEAAKIADEPEFCCSECVGGSVQLAIAKSLRSAAESVHGPRGGE